MLICTSIEYAHRWKILCPINRSIAFPEERTFSYAVVFQQNLHNWNVLKGHPSAPFVFIHENCVVSQVTCIVFFCLWRCFSSTKHYEISLAQEVCKDEEPSSNSDSLFGSHKYFEFCRIWTKSRKEIDKTFAQRLWASRKTCRLRIGRRTSQIWTFNIENLWRMPKKTSLEK